MPEAENKSIEPKLSLGLNSKSVSNLSFYNHQSKFPHMNMVNYEILNSSDSKIFWLSFCKEQYCRKTQIQLLQAPQFSFSF